MPNRIGALDALICKLNKMVDNVILSAYATFAFFHDLNLNDGMVHVIAGDRDRAFNNFNLGIDIFCLLRETHGHQRW
jgi:hypothetical protein